MPVYNSNLFSLSSQVSAYKPNTNKSQVAKDLNGRIRGLLDFRNSWSDLITRYVINIPQAYTTGGITTVSGSQNIVGVGTSWPYSDVVNTTMVSGNRSSGFVEITPASMNGIAVDSFLYVSDGGYSEAVPVTEVSATTFTAQFQFSHNDGTPLTMSSLAGRQIQYGPQTPIYTLTAVSSAVGSANTGIMDMPWGGAALTASGYQIVKAYITIPNFRSWLQVWDPQQGIPLATNVSQAELDCIDAQRSAQGWPQCLADLGPSLSGSYQVEVYPWQATPYAIPVLYNAQWPALVRPTDRSPGFINPTVIIDGAIADALRRKDIRNPGDSDPYFNPQLAREFDEKFVLGATLAANADEERCQQRLSSQFWQRSGASSGQSAAFWQSHVFGPGDGGW